MAEDARIDLVMSDINMPVMDGLTLLAKLGDASRIVQTVIVSAYGDMQNIRTAMNRGAYDFLTKPIDFDDFEVTVSKTRRALDEIKLGAQAREQLTEIQDELKVATRIQQSILPRRFPPFPERRDFSIFAEMTPARAWAATSTTSFSSTRTGWRCHRGCVREGSPGGDPDGGEPHADARHRDAGRRRRGRACSTSTPCWCGRAIRRCS